MIINQLAAGPLPYKLEAGEGARFAFGGHLATVLAGPSELGQTACGVILTGAKGAAFPLHSHESTHEAMFVRVTVGDLMLNNAEPRSWLM